MAVTPAELRVYAPHFADITDFPDLILQMMIDEAELRTDRTQWGLKSDLAVRYFALHLLTMWAAALVQLDEEGNPIPGSGGGVPSGAVTWEQVGTLQRRYSSGSSTVGAQFVKPYTDAWWEASPYGQAYASLLQEFFASRVIGDVEYPYFGAGRMWWEI